MDQITTGFRMWAISAVFRISGTDVRRAAAISALALLFGAFPTGIFAQQNAVLAKESIYAREISEAKSEIEVVIPEEVRIVGFARRADKYVVNLESSDTKHIARALKAIDDLPGLGSPELVGYTEHATPSFVTLLIKKSSE